MSTARIIIFGISLLSLTVNVILLVSNIMYYNKKQNMNDNENDVISSDDTVFLDREAREKIIANLEDIIAELHKEENNGQRD